MNLQAAFETNFFLMTQNFQPFSWLYKYDQINTGQYIWKHFCICDEYVINLFVCIYEVKKWT